MDTAQPVADATSAAETHTRTYDEPKDALIATDATPEPNATEKSKDRKGADTKAPEREAAPSVDLKAKVKAKINDKEEDVTVEDLIRTYQKERAADEKFRKAAEVEKRLAALEQEREREAAMLKQDPWAVLKERGLDPDELAEKRLLEKIRLESMSESERKAHDLEQENMTLKEKAEQWERQQKEQQERLAQQQKNELKLKQVQRIDTELTSELRERGLKPTPQVLEAVAQHMLAHLTHKGGNHNITVRESLEHVLKQHDDDFYGRVESEEIDRLMQRLSPKKRDALRKWFVNQVTHGRSPQQQTATPKRAQGVKRGSTDSFFDNISKKFG
jgi:hypothetical protein